MADLPTGPMGYAIESENRAELEHGEEPLTLANRFRETKPSLNVQANPLGIATIYNQGSQGSCVGHALAQVFSICYFLSTGQTQDFSRAAAYYLSQKVAGINGDRGSTLGAARVIAVEKGLCTEEQWPYPSRYNPREPSPKPDYAYKLSVSRPFRTIYEMREWLELGLPIQTGVVWGSSMSREVVTDASRSGGGHSTVLWTMRREHANNINSWGANWNGDGVHAWTMQALEQMLQSNRNTFVGYSPDNMTHPEPPAPELET